MKVFAERLKELREEKEMTQREIAKILQIAQASYSRYEMNTGEPSLETVVVIAKFFDVSTDYLLGLED